MNIVRAGLATLGAAGVGYGMSSLFRHDNASEAERTAQAVQYVGDQKTAYHDWKHATEAQFPGGKLDTPSDHARFDAFLQANPAPAWVEVKHDEFTRIQTRALETPLPDGAPYKRDESTPAGLLIGGSLGVAGAVAAVAAVRSKLPTSAWTPAAFALGGAAVAAFGVTALGTTIAELGDDKYPHTELAYQLTQEVNADGV